MSVLSKNRTGEGKRVRRPVARRTTWRMHQLAGSVEENILYYKSRCSTFLRDGQKKLRVGRCARHETIREGFWREERACKEVKNGYEIIF